jgi:hypothetical protein
MDDDAQLSPHFYSLTLLLDCSHISPYALVIIYASSYGQLRSTH